MVHLIAGDVEDFSEFLDQLPIVDKEDPNGARRNTANLHIPENASVTAESNLSKIVSDQIHGS
ncbi:hypothetical protein [Fodinicurvata sediminis]|uniref:hypothetical protein n=1 Tax=Fodinicurvata sediminis TaxID=1121832 RepID=UPI0003B72952|nr:hypothetical protein [Fodinicurvata sediminis]